MVDVERTNVVRSQGLCTKKESRALIERPYSREPQAVGAVYDRPGFFVESRSQESPSPAEKHRKIERRAWLGGEPIDEE
jgi:hypothetical protein